MIIYDFIKNGLHNIKESAVKIYTFSSNKNSTIYKISTVCDNILHKEKSTDNKKLSIEGHHVSRDKFVTVDTLSPLITIPTPIMKDSSVVQPPIVPPTDDNPRINRCWDDAAIQKLISHNPANLEIRDIKGQTPLMYAVDTGSLELARALLDLGANIEATQKNSDYTPLHLAVSEENLEMVRLLLEKKANIEVRANDQSTPLHLAVSKENLEITKQLLSNQANVDALDQDLFTPLHLAVKAGNLEITESLLEKGANIQAREQDGSIPLHWAARLSNLQTAELLLRKGAHVNERDLYGQTPMHWAAINGDKQLTELLLNNGANIEAKENANNCTPLHVAAAAGSIDLVKFLLERGANANALNSIGYTPAMAAQVFLQTEVQQLLEERSGNFGKLWITQKLLAARFAIDLKLLIDEEIINLQILNAIITYPELLQSFEQFFLTKQESKTWKLNDFKEVLDTLQHGCELRKTQDVESIMERLAQQQTVAIPTGWMGHNVGIVIKGDLLFKCNRGERAQHLPAGILVYKIDKPENLREAIEQLFSNESQTTVSNNAQHYFESEMDQKLGLQHIDTIDCHEQSADNCTWASAKLVLRTTLYAQLLKKGISPEIAQAKTRKLYKAWSAQDRLQALQRYSQLVKGESPPGKQELFMKILQKYKHRSTVSHQALIQELCQEGLVNSAD